MPRRPSATAETSASAPKSPKPKKKAAPRKKKTTDDVVPAAELSAATAAAAPETDTFKNDLDTPISYSIPEPAEETPEAAISPAEPETAPEPADQHVEESVPQDIQPIDEAPEPAQDVQEPDETPAIANTVGAAGAMSDIKPKLSEPADHIPVMPPPAPSLNDLPRTPVSSKADASFLQSDNRSFGLKEQVQKKGNWVTRTAYILGTLIILMILALVGITYFTNRAVKNQNQTVNQQVDQTAQDAQNSGNAIAPASSNLKFAITGPSADYIATLAQNVTSKNPALTQDTAAQTNLPKLTADTLLYKTSAKDAANSLLTYLGTLGIKPQLQESTTIGDDMVLYLTPILAKPDLTGQVATVYNASGKTGAAKTFCDALKKDLATSCSALNFTGTPPTGLQVYAKSQADYFILKRTATFQSATFHAADSKQVEDLKVVIGK